MPTTLFFRDDLEVAIKEIINLDSECIEIVCESCHFSPDSLQVSDEVLQILKDENMDLSVHGSFFDINLGSYYPKIRAFAVERAKQAIDLCASIGSNIITFHPGYFLSPDHQELWEELKQKFHESIEKCLNYARKKNVRIGLENIQVPYFFYSDLKELGRFVENKHDLGITLDIAHSYLLKRQNGSESPEEEISRDITKLGESIEHVHLHDNTGGGDKHLPPGEGEINFGPIIQALREIGYDHRVIVEVHRADKPVEAGRHALKATKQLLE